MALEEPERARRGVEGHRGEQERQSALAGRVGRLPGGGRPKPAPSAETAGSRTELLFARSKLVVDSAAAGIRPPFDAVYMDVGDERGLRDEAELAPA